MPRSPLNPWSKVSSALSCLVGRFGGKKVHRTFFSSLLTPSSAVSQRTTLLSPRSPRHYHASSVGSEEKRFPEPFFLSSSPHLPQFLKFFIMKSKVSASLRSVQNRGPPDLVHPIFHIVMFSLKPWNLPVHWNLEFQVSF